MIAVVGGLGAAFAWATATMTATRAARLIPPTSVLAWVMLTGLVVTLPWAVVQGAPHIGSSSAAWLLVSGAGNCAGLLLVYSALRIGKVGVVAPIVSTEGAIAAIIAVAAGETLAAGTVLALAVVATGTILAGTTGEPTAVGSMHGRKAVLLACAAAVSFGVSLYATGQVGSELPLVWAILPARVFGVLVIAIPLALAGRLTLTRRAAPFVVGSGLAEVVGVSSYALGARHGIAVSAVLASQFGAVAAIAAYLLFHERLGGPQTVGVVAIAAGVAALTALQAA
ncbi:MAG TPA: EamA family transporter [Gaiellaceae bacterium]|nr:EamA family transporter [Gaiellaceae bacterium]